MDENERLTLYVETTEKGRREEFRLELRNETGGQGRGGEKATFLVNRFAINGSERRRVNTKKGTQMGGGRTRPAGDGDRA
jgi:hypothetical protein